MREIRNDVRARKREMMVPIQNTKKNLSTSPREKRAYLYGLPKKRAKTNQKKHIH
jgi:hypothetical protein